MNTTIQKRQENILLDMVLSSKDARCQALINQHGPEGYGIYLMLVSLLISSPTHKLQFEEIEALSHKFKSSVAKILDTVKNYNLFALSDSCFYIEEMLNKHYKS